MAIRQIITKEDELLRKKSREVTDITPKILQLLDDMKDTLKKANGVGLAAPQVSVLKRVVVIDVGEGAIELINPVAVYKKGKVTDSEGCLSVPGVWGEVERPEKVIVRYLNRFGETMEIQGEGLLARALCHEIDHLNGILFTDKVTRYIDVEDR